MSDEDVQQAIAVLKRHGWGPEDFMEQYPELRHTPGMTHGLTLERLGLETYEEWQMWRERIPVMHFDPEWDVRIIPPTTGAIVRFLVNGLSIYLDCYARLGTLSEPYWELYPYGNDVGRFLMADVEGLFAAIREELCRT